MKYTRTYPARIDVGVYQDLLRIKDLGNRSINSLLQEGARYGSMKLEWLYGAMLIINGFYAFSFLFVILLIWKTCRPFFCPQIL